jgi:hypothetical protein
MNFKNAPFLRLGRAPSIAGSLPQAANCRFMATIFVGSSAWPGRAAGGRHRRPQAHRDPMLSAVSGRLEETKIADSKEPPNRGIFERAGQ